MGVQKILIPKKKQRDSSNSKKLIFAPIESPPSFQTSCGENLDPPNTFAAVPGPSKIRFPFANINALWYNFCLLMEEYELSD